MSINQNKSSPFVCHSHGLSDTGRVRSHNEDAFLEYPAMGLWAVADGMGGHAAGDVASQMIVSSLKAIDRIQSLDEFVSDIEDKLTEVNQTLINRANENTRRITIGSTVVMLITYDKYCVYLWAGDSRLYRLRNRELRQMTTDHSQVEQYVERGLISRKEAVFHPHKNMITRAIGASDDFFLDMDIQEMQAGDRYLLCSDGLTRHIVDLELQEILPDGDLGLVCGKLINLTLDRGARDNVTAVLIDVEKKS